MSLSSLLAALKGGTSPNVIEHDDLQKACLESTHHVIDVREPHEYATGHLPGAVNHPLSSFDPLKLPEGKPVVLVCQAGGRSAKALAVAQGAGHTNIVHFPPGTGGWKARGGKIAS